jgi:hypothetical protein
MTCLVFGATHERNTVRLLLVAWLLVGVGAVALVTAYANLPGSVVLYRPPWADVPTMGSKSFLVTSLALWAVFAVAPRVFA